MRHCRARKAGFLSVTPYFPAPALSPRPDAAAGAAGNACGMTSSTRYPLVLAGAAALAAALLLAIPAGATTQAFTILKAGDEIDIVDTSVLCLVSKGSSGRMGIVCFRANAKGAIPGTYFAGIGQDGRVLAGVVDAKREPKITFQRTLASAAGTSAATVRRKGTVGKVFRISGSTVDCAIVRSGTGTQVPTVYCSKDDKVGPVPGTYAVLVSDQVAGVGKIQETRSTTMIWVKNQPKK